MASFPKLVAFDLDYTLWDLWIDTHVTGPLRRQKDTLNKVVDKHGEPVSFYKDVAGILHQLKAEGVVIVAASRTSAPRLARQALDLLLLPPPENSEDRNAIRAVTLFDEMEIYPGSKLNHFQRIHKSTGIPYEEMLFFDDESRNREVEKLGVTFYLVPDGVHNEVFEKGLEEWRRRHSIISE